MRFSVRSQQPETHQKLTFERAMQELLGQRWPGCSVEGRVPVRLRGAHADNLISLVDCEQRVQRGEATVPVGGLRREVPLARCVLVAPEPVLPQSTAAARTTLSRSGAALAGLGAVTLLPQTRRVLGSKARVYGAVVALCGVVAMLAELMNAQQKRAQDRRAAEQRRAAEETRAEEASARQRVDLGLGPDATAGDIAEALRLLQHPQSPRITGPAPVEELTRLFEVSRMAGRSKDVFITHAQSTGQDQCKWLYEKLTQAGYKVWYDMYATDLTAEGMEKGVSQCRVVLIFLSDGYFTRPFCLTELRWAKLYGCELFGLVEKDTRHGPADFGLEAQRAPKDLKHGLADVEFLDYERRDYKANAMLAELQDRFGTASGHDELLPTPSAVTREVDQAVIGLVKGQPFRKALQLITSLAVTWIVYKVWSVSVVRLQQNRSLHLQRIGQTAPSILLACLVLRHWHRRNHSRRSSVDRCCRTLRAIGHFVRFAVDCDPRLAMLAPLHRLVQEAGPRISLGRGIGGDGGGCGGSWILSPHRNTNRSKRRFVIGRPDGRGSVRS